MASAWGKSWGKSWGNAWGTVDEPAPAQPPSAGGQRRRPRPPDELPKWHATPMGVAMLACGAGLVR